MSEPETLFEGITGWYYILDENHEPVEVHDIQTWGKFFEDTPKRIVAKSHSADGKVEVSTVFIGINHRFTGPGQPLLFESMIFGGDQDGEQERCCTWNEAVEMHARMCALAGVIP